MTISKKINKKHLIAVFDEILFWLNVLLKTFIYDLTATVSNLLF